jgi:hypothetical protein
MVIRTSIHDDEHAGIVAFIHTCCSSVNILIIIMNTFNAPAY